MKKLTCKKCGNTIMFADDSVDALIECPLCIGLAVPFPVKQMELELLPWLCDVPGCIHVSEFCDKQSRMLCNGHYYYFCMAPKDESDKSYTERLIKYEQARVVAQIRRSLAQ